MPSQNRIFQATSGGAMMLTAQNAKAAAAHPTDQLLCTSPVALPRWRASMISATNTEPTDHSPPKPNPCKARVKNSSPKLCVKPLKKVNSANHRTVSCRMRARPKRSASTPAAQPPIAEVTSAPVAM